VIDINALRFRFFASEPNTKKGIGLKANLSRTRSPHVAAVSGHSDRTPQNSGHVH
jgi:hypothetical protein